MAISSIKNSDEIIAASPTLWPHSFSLDAYTRLLTTTNFLTYFKNSIIVAAITTYTVVITGSLGAYSLTRYRFIAREAVARSLLIGYVFPPILMIIPLFVFAYRLGLADSLLGLSLANISFALPFALWILRAFFQSVPVELEEAVLTDGGGRPQAFAYVLAPLILPGIIATSIFTFILVWEDYLIPSVLITRDQLKTLPVGVNDLFQGLNFDYGLIMAAGVFITIPAVAFFIATQRHLIEGWGAGGVKG